MTIERATEKLQNYYKCALELNKKGELKIFDPVAWALYQTWVDADERGKNENNAGIKENTEIVNHADFD